MTSFISSEGWIPNELNPIHRLEPPELVPIPGTKRRKYLEENIRAIEVELSPAERKEIDEKLPLGMTAGDRYPAEAMKAVNR